MILPLKQVARNVVRAFSGLKMTPGLQGLLDELARAVTACDPEEVPAPAESLPSADLPSLSFAAYERSCLARALEECDGCAQKAARILHVGNSTVYRKVQKHQLKDHGRPA